MRSNLAIKYLRENPTFLRRHRVELTRLMRLAERDIIDMTGRQLVTLRDENTVLHKQLAAWYTNASENEVLSLILHQLTLKFLGGIGKLTVAKIEKILDSELAGQFNIDKCRLFEAKSLGIPDPKKKLLTNRKVFREQRPWPKLVEALGKNRWRSHLCVPVFAGKRLSVVLIICSKVSQAFPADAHDDYVGRLGDLIGATMK